MFRKLVRHLCAERCTCDQQGACHHGFEQDARDLLVQLEKAPAHILAASGMKSGPLAWKRIIQAIRDDGAPCCGKCKEEGRTTCQDSLSL